MAAQAALPGLVAAYGFDEGAGSIAPDASGNGNDGSLENGAFHVATGRFGGAIQLDGIDDHVLVPDSDSLDPTTALTLEAWVRPTSLQEKWAAIVQKDPDAWLLHASQPGGSLQPAFGGTFDGSVDVTFASLPLALDQWTHLAATYDGFDLRIYLNGLEVASQPQTGLLEVSTLPLRIGANTYGSEDAFEGLIDEVRIYDRALSAAEIVQDRDSPVTGGDPPVDTTPPLVGIVLPVDGATVSGIVTPSADASDDVGVVGVHFEVDGQPIGVEDPTAPYEQPWDSASFANGPHTLSAIARDAAGNTATDTITVQVSNLIDSFTNDVVATGLGLATTMEFLPDGRMLIGDLYGTIRVLQPGATQPDPQPFLVIPNVGLESSFQGFMDTELDPDFENDRFLYTLYTAAVPNRNRVSRFTATVDLTGVEPGSELVLWQDEVDAGFEHHGGSVEFGPDGMLYFTIGDNGTPSDAQQLTNYHGKVLRIASNGTVPTDNPFYDGPGPNKDAIWAYGLRSPFRMNFDPATGRMFIGDVGGDDSANSHEEVNEGQPGANFGWPLCDGPCSVPGTTNAVHAYSHAGRDASVTAGFVYRGTQFPPEFDGSFFFGDYAQNWIKRLTFEPDGSLLEVLDFEPPDGSADGPYGDIVQLEEGPDGALYYLDLGFSQEGQFGESKLRRIRYVSSNPPPTAVASATPTSGLPPLTVAFSSAGSSDPEGDPLTYDWDFGDGESSIDANPTHLYQASGRYVATLTVSDGSNVVFDTVTLSVGNAPDVSITAPPVGAPPFRAGDVVTFVGSATDVEDGTLPASAYSWQINLHHNAHVHPTVPTDGVTSVDLVIPRNGHDFREDTYYSTLLTVTDSDGLQTTRSIVIQPDEVDLTFDTVPSGLQVFVDGVPFLTPFTRDALIGFEYEISAPDQSLSGIDYTFSSWSDLGGQSHVITTPAVDAAYVATLVPADPPPRGLAAASYPFDEGSGTIAGDESGQPDDGALNNGPAWVPGRYGTGLSFDGVDDDVAVANGIEIDVTGSELSFSAWLKPADDPSDDVVFAKHASSGPFHQYALEIHKGTLDELVCYVAVDGVLGQVATTAFSYGVWQHVACVYDGASLSVYVDGALRASVPLAGSLSSYGESLHVGMDHNGAQHYVGELDNLRIYDRALSAGEVIQDMNTPLLEVRSIPALSGWGVHALDLVLLLASTLLVRRRARAAGHAHARPARRA